MNKKNLFIAFAISAACIFSACKSTKTPEKLTPLELLKRNRVDEAKAGFVWDADINAVDENGNTVLHLAAKMNDAELVTYFLFKGADSELKNYESDTPLHVAVKNGSVAAAQAIVAVDASSLFSRDIDNTTALDLGLSIDESYYDAFITTKAGEVRDTDGQTIVHYFVRTKNLTAIQYCVKKGLPLSVKDNSGLTPLDVAFKNIEDVTSVEIAAELIMGGAEEVDTPYDYFQQAIAARNVNTRFDDGQTSLHIASIMGHAPVVEYLLDNGADTAVQDSSGATPLHESVRYGNVEIIRLLLNFNADPDARDNLGKTPIMLIMPREKTAEVYTLLVRYRADLNQKDMYGDTVLHTAAMLNVDTDTISILTNNGADVNARNKEGVTPLAIAIQKGDVQTARLLSARGANIHTQDTHGQSPLTLALASEPEMTEAVINSINVMSQDSDGNTPLHIAIITDASLTKIQYIVSLMDDVNTRNRNGNSALFLATLKNRQKVGELLLAKNADIFSANTNNNSPVRLALRYGGTVQEWIITSRTINSKDGSGNSVLHYAAEWQYAKAIESVLAKGADIHAKNANGETPLFSAAKTNNPEIIQLIVNGGADLNARDNLGSSALHMAVRWDADKSVRKLISLGLNINVQNSSGKSPLSDAVVAGKYEIARLLLQHGADVNSIDTNGVTPIMDAIRANSAETVALLLEYGANPNMQEVNGQNAYHEAAYMGDIEIIRMVRNAGGNPMARDRSGKTPFSISLNKDEQVIKEILGKSYTITDSDGNTPLHVVVTSKGALKIMKMLIEEGYPLDTRNADGYTPLAYAIEADDMNAALVLLENGANPFQMIDKKGRNGVTIALEKNNLEMIGNIVKYAGRMTDVQGNTILHYAARLSSEATMQKLLAFGLDKSIKNVSGDTAFTIATRWRRTAIANLLK
ncbi:MAG: ankyrin repeat domain-containing protein [Treponema sp.]|nr:ankyrin repeat domain-containing protein [Treponema sp.]